MKLKLAGLALILSFAVVWFSGCNAALETVEFVKPEAPPDANMAYDGYHHLILNQSTSADALSAIHLPDYELLSQSKNVIASFGTKKKKDTADFKAWFKMVAFDEQSLTVQRKYLFIDDERPKYLFNSDWPTAVFDCIMVIGPDVLQKPYNNDNARRLAVFQQVIDNFRKDIVEVRLDNNGLATRGMMVNQTLEIVRTKLNASPAMAAKLSDPDGLRFDHISMQQGKIKMNIEGNIVSLKFMIGSIASGKLNLEKQINTFSKK
jgi:hypothetical protein